MADMKEAMNYAIVIFVGALLASILLPIAISNWFDANQTGWGNDTITIWDVTPVLIVLAVFIFFIAMAVDRYG